MENCILNFPYYVCSYGADVNSSLTVRPSVCTYEKLHRETVLFSGGNIHGCDF